MGRLSKPIGAHEAEGTYRPERHGPRDHVLDELPSKLTKPEMPPDASELWDVIVPLLEELNILATVDQYHLEGTCREWATYQQLSRLRDTLTKGDNAGMLLADETAKLEQRIKRSLELFEKMSKHFGLTPATRASLRKNLSNAETKQDPLEEFGIVG